MRKGVIWAMILGAVSGCGRLIPSTGPKVGETYRIEPDRTAAVYCDEQLFRDAVDRATAGVGNPTEAFIKDVTDGRIVVLGEGTKFKTVGNTEGGMKVVVLTKKQKGKVGWMLRDVFGFVEKVTDQ